MLCLGDSNYASFMGGPKTLFNALSNCTMIHPAVFADDNDKNDFADKTDLFIGKEFSLDYFFQEEIAKFNIYLKSSENLIIKRLAQNGFNPGWMETPRGFPLPLTLPCPSHKTRKRGKKLKRHIVQLLNLFQSIMSIHNHSKFLSCHHPRLTWPPPQMTPLKSMIK